MGMQDTDVRSGFRRLAHRHASSSDASQKTPWVWRILPLLVFTAAVVAAACWYWQALMALRSAYLDMAFAVVLSIFLSLLPAMICVVQNTTKKRQLNRLSSLEEFPVGKSVHFRTASTALDAMKMGGVDADYEAPIFVYFFILFVGFITVFIGYGFNGLFTVPTVLLGGLKPAGGTDYVAYQLQTFVVVSVAFLASYVYSLGRLLDRVNNNDIYPISLYYYAVRIVIACVVAAVMRHAADTFGIKDSPMLMVVAFGIGFAPDLFVWALIRRGFQVLKIWGNRDDPSADTHPKSLPLLMIDDLTRDKIDRLNELGIDSAQVLARQNPFLLLPRLPYELGLIVDWIGQAQLYVLVKDANLMLLREKFVRDLCDLYIRLDDPAARAEIAEALRISDAAALALKQQLDGDQSFVRLREVRTLMLRPMA
jgi:hypothetical protein